MRRLRDTDGTSVHLRAALYHWTMCAEGLAPMPTLHAEMSVLHANLRAKARAREDAEGEAVKTDASAMHGEFRLQDTLRDIDAEAGLADRANPSLGMRAALFPHGFGELIEPEGQAQLDALVPWLAQLEPFKTHPRIAPLLVQLKAQGAALQTALNADAAAETLVDSLFGEELQMRREIREQMESAYGRLRVHFKAMPALSERYFLNEGSGRKRRKEGVGDPKPG